MDNLKPCPFCGETGETKAIMKSETESASWNFCGHCLASGPYNSISGPQAQAWNTRPREERLEGLLEKALLVLDWANDPRAHIDDEFIGLPVRPVVDTAVIIDKIRAALGEGAAKETPDA